MPPELTEEEYQDLQRSKEEAARARQEAEQEKQNRQALQQQYQNDIQQVTAYVGSLMQGGQHGPAPQQQGQADEDDELFVQHPKLKQRLGMVEQNAAQQIQRVAGTLVHSYMKDQLESNLRSADGDPELRPFLKYKDEVAKLLRQGIQQDGRLGSMDAVKRAFRLVASEHLDDIVSERVKAKPADDEEYEDETGGASQPVPRAGGATPPPVSLAPSARASTPPPKGQRVRLSWGEKNMAERFGMSGEDYAKYKDDKHEEDVLGFRGRRRI